VIAFSVISCTHNFYYPNTHNIPTHDGAHEAAVSAICTTSDEAVGFELQGAYSLTDHIGLAANFLYAYDGNKNVADYGDGVMADIGIGYFNKNKYFYSSLYGGVGYCRQNHAYFNDAPSNYYKVGVQSFRGYIQPAVGLSTMYFEALASLRFSALAFPVVDNTIDRSIRPADYDRVAGIKSGQPYFLAEPALTLRGGVKNLKIQSQIGVAYELRDKDIHYNYFVSIGAYYTLTKK